MDEAGKSDNRENTKSQNGKIDLRLGKKMENLRDPTDNTTVLNENIEQFCNLYILRTNVWSNGHEWESLCSDIQEAYGSPSLSLSPPLLR
jgi:hypothetical protein